MIISLIAAMSENHVIGINNRLPWHMPADLAYFKKITADKKFIMGRKTYEADDSLLSNTCNVIVTRQANYKVSGNDKVANSLQQAIELLHNEAEVFVLGGSEIFTQAIALADTIYLTVIHHRFTGDAFFPVIDTNTWRVDSQNDYEADRENPYPYSFIKYTRQKS